MNTMLDELYRIEVSANAVLDRAAARKSAMTAAHQKRLADYTAQSEKITSETIFGRKEEIRSAMTSNLEIERVQTQKQIECMEKLYDTNHTALAQQVFSELIRSDS